jgi:hypothetical protein
LVELDQGTAASQCPQLAKADMRAFTMGSGFDPAESRIEISQRNKPPDLILANPLCCRSG